MKRKALFIAALVGLGTIANAQTTQVTKEDGTVVTPEAGDWAIGFNASPIFNYVGNAFNGSTSNSLNSAFMSGNNAIYGKYFKDENTAYRGQIRIGSLSNTMNYTYGGTTADSLTNTVKYSGAAIVLGAGMEKRRGHNRLQGYYGAEVLISFGGTNASEKYSYGTKFDTASLNAGLIPYNVAADSTYAPMDYSATRVNSKKYGSTFGVGVRAFIGAEYFFLPKISVAAEYGWGVSFSSTSGSVTEYSQFDSKLKEETITTEGGKSSKLAIDTDNLGGAIRLMFHF